MVGRLHRAVLGPDNRNEHSQVHSRIRHYGSVNGRVEVPSFGRRQAGRAIVASCGHENASSHGLTVHDDDLESTNPFEWRVSPTKNGGGWFQTVADATDSPGLSRPVALGALIASLPELSKPILREDSWASALYVEPLPNMGQLRVNVEGSTWLRLGLAIDHNEAGSSQRIVERLQGYPTLIDQTRGDVVTHVLGLDPSLDWLPC